jgi:hypothetical protein
VSSTTASLVDFTQWSMAALAENGIWIFYEGQKNQRKWPLLPASVKCNVRLERYSHFFWMPSAASSGHQRNQHTEVQCRLAGQVLPRR